MWLTKLKIAIVLQDADSINELLEDIPQLTNLAEIESAMFLLDEAKQIVTTLKNSTSTSMIQMQKNIQFLKATQTDSPSKFDIIS